MRLLEQRRAATIPDVLWWLLVPFVVMVLNSTGVHNDLRHGSVALLLVAWRGRPLKKA
jgi:hypothetical protein